MAKKMSAKEKRERREAREFLRSEGLMPPRKKPLNRAKFAEETQKEYEAMEKPVSIVAMEIAQSSMMPPKGAKKITSEEVGALKMLKIAMEIDRIRESEKNITYGEIFERVIKPIKEL